MALIFQGKVVACAAKVVDWQTSKLGFAPGSCGARRRTEPITQWVWHWTAGEGNASGCHRTLAARGLSVHFFLGVDGVIYQYADPALVVCAHAGKPTNGRSIGIEQQNVGHGRPNPRVPRDRVNETIRGVVRPTSQFTPAQVAAAISLRLAIAKVCATLGPIHVDPRAETLPLAFRNGWRGDLAHYQVSLKKRDPGTRFMEALAAAAP